MKFTVKVNGADQSLIARLTAAANRKLAPKLARYAKRNTSASSHAAPNLAAVTVGAAALGGAAVVATTPDAALQSSSTGAVAATGEESHSFAPNLPSDASNET